MTIKHLLTKLFLLFAFGFITQNVHANFMTLSCDILNENRNPQSTFQSDDTAILRVNVSLPNDGQPFDPEKEYRVDLKVTAKAKIKGFKIPFQLNESLSVPVKKVDDSLYATEETEVKIPSIHGTLTLNVSANIANVLDNKSKFVTCEKTLTIK
jgi:hypothetical protein